MPRNVFIGACLCLCLAVPTAAQACSAFARIAVFSSQREIEGLAFDLDQAGRVVAIVLQ
jgi:hypothetical protein